jgi:ribosomal protein S16
LVVAEKARPVKGKVLETVGHYLPARDPAVFAFEKERVEHWMKQGAALSDTAARLLSKQGVRGAEKYIERYTKKKPKGAAATQQPAAATAPATETSSTPAVEAK